jgi:hypothetical protein
MFHFPAFPPHTLCVQVWVTPHDWCRVSPFGHPGITARLTAPPGLSRPPTSFIGSWCQGIHRLLSATSQQRCSRPLCNSQTTTNPNPHTHHTRNPHGHAVWQAGPDRNREPKRRLFPQDPTGCLNTTTSRTTSPIHTPTRTEPGGPTNHGSSTRAGDRCRYQLHQCLRHRAPRRHMRPARAPYPLSRERCSLERR